MPEAIIVQMKEGQCKIAAGAAICKYRTQVNKLSNQLGCDINPVVGDFSFLCQPQHSQQKQRLMRRRCAIGMTLIDAEYLFDCDGGHRYNIRGCQNTSYSSRGHTCFHGIFYSQHKTANVKAFAVPLLRDAAT